MYIQHINTKVVRCQMKLLKHLVTQNRRLYSGVAVMHRTCDQWVVGSIPTGTKLRNNLGQVVHIYVLLSISSII